MSENVEGQLAGNPFVGELSARMVGGRAGAGVLVPLSVCVESIDGGRAVGKTEVPADGSPVALGRADGTWLEARVVCLPVYEDMTTYDYGSMDTTYWVDAGERDSSSAVVSVDVSGLPEVELTGDYLLSVADARIGYYESGAEMLADMAGRGWADSAAGSAARMGRRLEALRGVREKAARSAGGAGELVSLYEELCDADHLE